MATNITTRIASTVSAKGVVASSTGPIHQIKFTAEATKDPATLAQQLTKLQESVTAATRATRSHPMQSPVIFKDVAMGTGGASTKVTHNLGQPVQWLIVRWRGSGAAAGAGPSVEESAQSNPPNDITFLSYVTGLADVMVWATS